MTRQYAFPLPAAAAMGAEDFLPSPANEAALQWLVTRTPSQWPSHACVLWGPQGCGKTHLLNIWAVRLEAVQASLGDDTVARLAGGEAILRALAVDDADGIAGDRAAEEWMQHLFNATRAAKVPLLLTGRAPPSAWPLVVPDIATRLKSALSVAMDEPDDALMCGILLKLFADRQLAVEAGVVEYLARRLERTGTALRAAVETLDAAALEARRNISIPFAQDVLGLRASSTS